MRDPNLYIKAAEEVEGVYRLHGEGLHTCCMISNLYDPPNYSITNPPRTAWQKLLEPAAHASPRATVDDPFRGVEHTEETMNHRVFLLLMAATFTGWDE